MLLQVIPYVADQFEPGTYVFDGENLDSSRLLSTAGPVSVYSIDQNVFNTNEILSSGVAQSVMVFEPTEYKKADMLYSLDALIMTDFESDQTFSAEVLSTSTAFLVGSDDKPMQSIPSLEIVYSTVYFSFIEGEIQNDLGKSTLVPRVLDTRGLDQPNELVAALVDSRSDSTSKYAELSLDQNINTGANSTLAKEIVAPFEDSLITNQQTAVLNLVEDSAVAGARFKFVSTIGSKFEPESAPSNNPTFSM